jgi:glycerol kinase
MPYILAIDQGTTSSRAMIFDAGSGNVKTVAQQEFMQHFPADGWVEHDAEEIWSSTLAVTRQALASLKAESGDLPATIGITNQRETSVIWDRKTGAPVHRAIVWQDRRTAEFCAQLEADGHGALISNRTGLLIDPYFSGTKIRWMLDNVPGVRKRAERGELAFGTVDSWLIYKLSGGKRHVTDATNASRTMLFDIHRQIWDPDLLALLDVPSSLLPEVLDSAADFATTDAAVLGAVIPIQGVAGDQHAAMFGQRCFEPGMLKSTYGTGCFVMLNTGDKPIVSNSRLLTTVGYRLDGQVSYALEGSIFVAGAAVQWLRDGLRLIANAAETEEIAAAAGESRGVTMIPAFTGLGAPYWDPNARGALLGLTRDTGIGEIVVATLEAVCFQTRDLLVAMADDGVVPTRLRVDGGMVNNDWFAQRLADLSQVEVARPVVTETTATGAALLAGLRAGIYGSLAEISAGWLHDRSFTPGLDPAIAKARHVDWVDAVQRVR